METTVVESVVEITRRGDGGFLTSLKRFVKRYFDSPLWQLLTDLQIDLHTGGWLATFTLQDGRVAHVSGPNFDKVLEQATYWQKWDRLPRLRIKKLK